MFQLKRGRTMLYPRERIGLFIDGSNLFETTRQLRFDVDYKKFQEPFKRYGKIILANYYTAEHEDEISGNIKIRPIIDWLGYNGYNVITKATKTFTDKYGDKRIKGNMDIEMVVDMLVMSAALDVIILVSGDGDFTYVVKELQRRGKRVVVVSSLATEPAMIADLLRRQANEFIDLHELMPIIRRQRNE